MSSYRGNSNSNSGSGSSSKKKTNISSRSGSGQNQSSESQDFRFDSKNSEKNDFKNPRSSNSKSRKLDGSSTPNTSQSNQSQSLSMAEFPAISSNKENVMFDRTLWLLMHLVGKVVEVQVKNGDFYEGVFYTATTDKGLGVLLKMAKKKEKENENVKDSPKDASRTIENFIIYPTDFVQLFAKDVALDIKNEREFSTDTEISSLHGNVRERQLQPWIPDSSGSNFGSGGGLEDDIESSNQLGSRSGSKSEDWDQFAANKEKFGVESSWNEDFYTTTIDKSSNSYKQRQREAERIASEIERSSKGGNNFHVIEERGFEVDINEEDRYGAVIRNPTNANEKTSTSSSSSTNQPISYAASLVSGKYVPPQKRSSTEAGSNPKSQGDSNKGKEKQKEKEKESKDIKNIHSQDLSKKFSPKDIRKADSNSQNTNANNENADFPSSPKGGETNPVVSERLRLRLHLVSERLKNSAPINNSQNDFPTPNRSPLLSPLIGDARSINALSLEPSTPNLPENVLNEFLDFSLTSKKTGSGSTGGATNSFRERSLADLKSFSKSIEKKVVKNDSTSPSSPRKATSTSSQESTESTSTSSTKPKPEDETKPSTTTTSTPTSTSASASTTTSTSTTSDKKVNPTTPTKEETTSTTTTPTKQTTTATTTATTTTTESKLKMNPNARAFKPMSASSPSFTPGGSSTSSTTSTTTTATVQPQSNQNEWSGSHAMGHQPHHPRSGNHDDQDQSQIHAQSYYYPGMNMNMGVPLPLQRGMGMNMNMNQLGQMYPLSLPVPMGMGVPFNPVHGHPQVPHQQPHGQHNQYNILPHSMQVHHPHPYTQQQQVANQVRMIPGNGNFPHPHSHPHHNPNVQQQHPSHFTGQYGHNPHPMGAPSEGFHPQNIHNQTQPNTNTSTNTNANTTATSSDNSTEKEKENK